MSTVLNFGDLACLNDSAAGSLGAGIASLARADFPVARGFVITPDALAEFLKRPDIAAAMDMHRTGAEDPEESWSALKSQFARTRLGWSHEMEILTAYSGLGGPVSVTASTRLGASPVMVYPSSGEDLLAAAKHCWLAWLRTQSHGPDLNSLPAVTVRELPDSELSVELTRKGSEIRARAVFGLPEGLHDPAVSPDVFEFGPDGKLDRMEMRPQAQQFVARQHGPARVPVAPDFRGEEKLSGGMISQLAPAIEFMKGKQTVGRITLCFVSSRPIVYSASLYPDPGSGPEIPPRQGSVSLLGPPGKKVAPPEPAPVLAMRVFLRIESPGEISSVGDTYIDGIMITGNPLAKREWAGEFAAFAQDAKRKFRAVETVIEVSDSADPTLKDLAEACQAISAAGMRPGILIPGIRSPEELSKAVRSIRAVLPDTVKPAVWARVMYPSNLYFMDSMAADVMAVDADSLGRLMFGVEDGRWLNNSTQALEKALEQTLASRKIPLAVMSDDMVSMPTFLEFLVRKRADILCLKPQELATVRHIVASVEKRILIERGA